MEMRIVAVNSHAIFIQENNGVGWKQTQMRSDLFEGYMEKNFPAYYNEFLNADTSDEAATEFFYHYGETPEMRRKGIAYIYANEKK